MTEPYVGMPATTSPYSDCYPGTVIEVSKSGKTIKVQEDTSKLVSGCAYDGTAEYEYERNPNGSIMVFSLRKNGRWIRKGDSIKSGYRCSLGGRRRYYNPHF